MSSPLGSSSRSGRWPVRSSFPSRSPVSDTQPSLATARYVLGSPIRKRWARVARPTSTSSSPVANGSSVPAWPTLVPRGSSRRTWASTSCEVTPARFRWSRTPERSATWLSGELLAHKLAESLHELGIRHRRGEARGLRMPAAAELPRQPRHVHPGIGRAQAHLAHPLALLGEQLSNQHCNRGALDGAHVVDHSLGVGLERPGLLVVALGQVRDGDRTVVVALDRGQCPLEEVGPAQWQILVQPP